MEKVTNEDSTFHKCSFLDVDFPKKSVEFIDWWCPDTPPFRPRRTKPTSDLKIACVVGDRLFHGFRFESRILLLTPSNWENIINHAQPDILLIESCWISCTGHWYLAQRPESSEHDALRRLISLAKSKGIPTVYWHTLDVAYHDHFFHLVNEFDFVYCSDVRELDLLLNLGISSKLLSPAVQPALYNGFTDHEHRGDFQIDILYDGWSTLLRKESKLSSLRKLIPHGLNVIESRNLVYITRRKDLPQYHKSILGCTTSSSRLTALKYSNLMVTFDQDIPTKLEKQWMALEAVACRVPIFHKGTFSEDDIRRNFVYARFDEDEFIEDVLASISNFLYRQRVAQSSWRSVVLQETFSHRLQEICNDIGILFDWDEFPKVSIISPTYRPETMDYIVGQFDKQSYPNKELVVIINTSDSSIASLCRDKYSRQDIKILQVPEERFSGSCLNVGNVVSSGEYCFRMDDDDIYGENYIMDAMLHQRSIDAELFGKAPHVFHFCGSNKTYFRPESPSLAIITSDIRMGLELRVSGFTVSGKTEFFKQHRYPDHSFGAADSLLLHEIDTSNCTVALLDCCNAVAVRRDDVDSHTWRISEERLSSQFPKAINGYQPFIV